MSKPVDAITSVNQKVCVVGFGTANIVHEHHTVTRFTATLIIVQRIVGGRTAERRFRRTDGRSPGGDGYGGTEVYPACRRPGQPRSGV